MATILISGTNRGIGLEFTRQCLLRGDRVIATCRTMETADDLMQLSRSHDGLDIRQLDVSSSESMQDFVQQLAGIPIDIFINNAGPGPGALRPQAALGCCLPAR